MNLFKPTYRPPRKWILLQVTMQQQEIGMRYVVVDQVARNSDSVLWIPVTDIADLIKKVGKSLPYIIHLTGFGVLTRTTELVPMYKESLLVTGSEEDFYFSCFECRSTVGVSFIRKSLVQELMEALQQQKVFVWAIHTGPIPLLALADETTILRADYLIETTNGDIKKLERNPEENPGRIATEGGFLNTDAAYLQAIDRLLKTTPENYNQGLSTEEQASVKSNFKEYMRFVRLGVGILIFFLTTLVGNYFYVNYLNQQAADLESEIAGFGESLTLIDRLTQEKQRKMILVDNSGVQSAHYVSYYLDEIGASVPASVQLTDLQTFNLKEPLKPKRKVELESGQIHISGFSGNSKILDDWMEALERKSWVKAVELINYVRINDEKATFHLMVKLNE